MTRNDVLDSGPLPPDPAAAEPERSPDHPGPMSSYALIS